MSSCTYLPIDHSWWHACINHFFHFYCFFSFISKLWKFCRLILELSSLSNACFAGIFHCVMFLLFFFNNVFQRAHAFGLWWSLVLLILHFIVCFFVSPKKYLCFSRLQGVFLIFVLESIDFIFRPMINLALFLKKWDVR